MNANERTCETCRYDLGGGYENCRINLEAECGDDSFQAWEPKDDLRRSIVRAEEQNGQEGRQDGAAGDR